MDNTTMVTLKMTCFMEKASIFGTIPNISQVFGKLATRWKALGKVKLSTWDKSSVIADTGLDPAIIHQVEHMKVNGMKASIKALAS